MSIEPLDRPGGREVDVFAVTALVGFNPRVTNYQKRRGGSIEVCHVACEREYHVEEPHAIDVFEANSIRRIRERAGTTTLRVSQVIMWSFL